MERGSFVIIANLIHVDHNVGLLTHLINDMLIRCSNWRRLTQHVIQATTNRVFSTLRKQEVAEKSFLMQPLQLSQYS